MQISEEKIKDIIKQVVMGLDYMHSLGIMHRDIKPENILINFNGEVKLADFGFAKSLNEKPPFTDYISTRWYRAPEILLKFPHYDTKVDIFALGCVIAELLNLQPIFAGQNEIDHLFSILDVMGDISSDWVEGQRVFWDLKYKMGIKVISKFEKNKLGEIFKQRSFLLIDLLQKILVLDPEKRISAKNILRHSYFANDRKNSFFDNQLANFLNKNNKQSSENARKYSIYFQKNNLPKNNDKINNLNFSQKIKVLNNKVIPKNLSQKSLQNNSSQKEIYNGVFKTNLLNNIKNSPTIISTPLDTLRQLKMKEKKNLDNFQKNFDIKTPPNLLKSNYLNKNSINFNFDSLNKKNIMEILDNHIQKEIPKLRNMSNPNFFKIQDDISKNYNLDKNQTQKVFPQKY